MGGDLTLMKDDRDLRAKKESRELLRIGRIALLAIRFQR
jgi:hypothetical protein